MTQPEEGKFGFAPETVAGQNAVNRLAEYAKGGQPLRTFIMTSHWQNQRGVDPRFRLDFRQRPLDDRLIEHSLDIENSLRVSLSTTEQLLVRTFFPRVDEQLPDWDRLFAGQWIIKHHLDFIRNDLGEPVPTIRPRKELVLVQPVSSSHSHVRYFCEELNEPAATEAFELLLAMYDVLPDGS